MPFIADLHVHSKYSRATAKHLNLENLYIHAQFKGITVAATGDFTHPGWFAEIQEKLIPAEPGLFTLRDEIRRECDRHVPASCRGEVRFILETEISNIYKKNRMTRKNHNLIFMPDIESSARLNARLSSIGNLKSDGRPILGLDSKVLLEIMLDCSGTAFLIPAHIWTPWFSLLGSKSGFDSLEACFEDLSSEIFAVETGLSSDVPMNWRISELDTRTLVSNSDAHSPANLGRNANIFETGLSFPAIRSALKTKDPNKCLGTLDLYPEEGKYHMDGHRKCNVWLHPRDTILKEGICPVCEKPLTIGVLHRVEALADRPEGVTPETGLPYHYIIPLAEILSEIYSVGPKTQTVDLRYQTALEILGPELAILNTIPLSEIEKAGIPLLAEAVRRMRAGEVHISPGYDGEYGKITVFDPDERERLMGQQSLFAMPGAGRPRPKIPLFPSEEKTIPPQKKKETGMSPSGMSPDSLNKEQRQAVIHAGSPLLIMAGPGAGKTLTLTHRIAHLIRERGVKPENILAVTFTNRAAREMRERLAVLLDASNVPLAATFHAFCLSILREYGPSDLGGVALPGQPGFRVIDEDDRISLISEAVHQVRAKDGESRLRPEKASDLISTAKQLLLAPEDDLTPVSEKKDFTESYKLYQSLLENEGLYDYDDLILNTVRLLESDPGVREVCRARFLHLLVDEYQDLNYGQYRLVRILSPSDRELCVIGDPDQSIYGFRGSDVRYFTCFAEDYPQTRIIRLTQNYRSAEAILESAHQVIRDHSIAPGCRVYSGIQGIETLTILEAASEKAEAVAIGKIIERMVGGMGFHSVDFGKTGETGMNTDRPFSDFAVLYRTNAQGLLIADIFDAAGIPHQIATRERVWGLKGIAEIISLLKLIEGAGLLNDVKKILGLKGPGLKEKLGAVFKDRMAQGMMKTFWDGQSNQPEGAFPPEIEAWIASIRDLKARTTGMPMAEKIKYILDHTEIQEIISGHSPKERILERLMNLAEEWGHAPVLFFETLALQADPDMCEAHAQKVSLMSLHSAKGLEFPVVFIAGCEDGYLPFCWPGHETMNGDEERRLFYVGMTRARDQLFLTHARQRTLWGRKEDRTISPFVKDIEDRLITLEKQRAKPRAAKVQLSLFD
jgi:uncharacterized protein (TIGR00375 family)